MKIFAILFILLLPTFAFSQSRPNRSIVDQIAELGAEKSISVEHDPASKVTTIRAVSENFVEAESKKAGAKGMNFAIGMMYLGEELKAGWEPLKMSLWVSASKPVFAGTVAFQIYAGDALFNIKDVRVVRRDRDETEYVNFQLTRDQLKTLALQTNASFLIGRHSFTFTKSQLRLFADLHMATEVGAQ